MMKWRVQEAVILSRPYNIKMKEEVVRIPLLDHGNVTIEEVAKKRLPWCYRS